MTKIITNAINPPDKISQTPSLYGINPMLQTASKIISWSGKILYFTSAIASSRRSHSVKLEANANCKSSLIKVIFRITNSILKIYFHGMLLTLCTSMLISSSVGSSS